MKQSERSKEWIEEALFVLLKQKPFSKITITDITKKAGVARLTFYRNFAKKEDILQYHFDNIFREYLSSLDKNITDISTAIRQCLEFWAIHKEKAKILVDNNLQYLLYKPFRKYLNIVLARSKKYSTCTNNQKNFILGGMFFTFLSISKVDCKFNLEKVTNDIMRIIK